jgi:hypothetical protein
VPAYVHVPCSFISMILISAGTGIQRLSCCSLIMASASSRWSGLLIALSQSSDSPLHLRLESFSVVDSYLYMSLFASSLAWHRVSWIIRRAIRSIRKNLLKGLWIFSMAGKAYPGLLFLDVVRAISCRQVIDQRFSLGANNPSRGCTVLKAFRIVYVMAL